MFIAALGAIRGAPSPIPIIEPVEIGLFDRQTLAHWLKRIKSNWCTIESRKTNKNSIIAFSFGKLFIN